MRAWLFDIDGTLITSQGAGVQAMFQAALEMTGISLDDSEISFHGNCDLGIIKSIFEETETDFSEENIAKFKETYLNYLQSKLQTMETKVLKGGTELLNILADREDVSLGLLTGNLVRGAQLKLQSCGLWKYFNYGGYGDSHENRNDVAKMAKRKFLELYTENRDPEIWVVGDTPNDIKCAKSIGANVIAVATGVFDMDALDRFNPDILVEDLTQLMELLPKLDLD